jgi:hypothetical protein
MTRVSRKECTVRLRWNVEGRIESQMEKAIEV